MCSRPAASPSKQGGDAHITGYGMHNSVGDTRRVTLGSTHPLSIIEREKGQLSLTESHSGFRSSLARYATCM